MDNNTTFCSACGAQLTSNDSVCPSCRTPVSYQAQPAYQQPAYQAPVYGGYSAPAAPAGSKGKFISLSIVSLVLGITTLFFSFFTILFFLTLPCGIVGIILGAISKKEGTLLGMPVGRSTAGIVLSIVGLGLNLILVIFLGIGLAS